jgi:hypothetical protein
MDSDFSNESFPVKIIAETLSITFFITFITLLFLAMRRIKCELQKSALVLMCTYTLCVAHRLACDSLRLSITQDQKKQTETILILRFVLLIQRIADTIN